MAGFSPSRISIRTESTAEAPPATRLSRSSIERSVKDSSSGAGRNRSNDRRRKRLQKPLFFTLECHFPMWTWNNQRSSIARSSGLNLVRRRLFKIAREPSANANLESAQPEPAGRRRAQPRNPKARDAIFRAHLRRARDKPLPDARASASRILLEGLNQGPGVVKWLANSAARNLPLAASPRVGHIRLTGAVAEWLKAAVC